jgi:acid stress-induced BolA-like protein IbaG/YrbA
MPATTKARPKSRRPRDREVIKQALVQVLRAEFPNDTVDVSDGYLGNIHVVVVSRRFDQMSEKEKQQLLWDLIERSELSDAEKERISLVYPVSVAELK